jgi:hypothetical protein
MADSLKACANTGMRTLTPPSLLACLGALLLSAPAVAQQTVNITTNVTAYHVCGNGNNGGLGSGNCGASNPDRFDSTEVTGNTVTVTASVTGYHDIYGAFIEGLGDLKVEGNLVTINAPGETVDSVIGGMARDNGGGSGTATNNRTVFLDGSVINGAIYGGRSNSDSGLSRAVGNRVDMSGGHAYYGVYGGQADNHQGFSLSENNHIEIFGSANISGDIYAGYASSNTMDSLATGNTAVVSGPVSAQVIHVGGHVFGGRAAGRQASVTNNHVTISGDVNITGEVLGGFARSMSLSGVATLNSVTMTGGLVLGSGQTQIVHGIAGGYIESPDAAATYNVVTISGGAVGGYSYIYGGFADDNGYGTDVFATNNTVTISGTPSLSGVGLYGGGGTGGASSDFFTGNTLNVKTTALDIRELGNFQFLDFYLPVTVANGMTMLDVSGTADLTHSVGRLSEVGIVLDGASLPLQTGDQIVLINAGSIVGTPFNTQAVAYGTQSATLQYEFDLSVAASQLIATLGSVSVRNESKSLSEGYLTSTAMLGQGSSFLVQQGMEAAREAIQSAAAHELARPRTFVIFSGGRMRYNTGSHVDVEGHSLIAGLANSQRLGSGEATLAGFFEYGKGDYTSHNSFASGTVKGQGDTEYKGMGLIGRFDFTDIVYLEGSLRVGQTETSYRSDDLTDATGRGARYDADGGYVGAHLGVGKNWKLGDKDTFNTYVQAIWTHQAKDTLTLSTGDRVQFDAIDSERLRVGARFSHAFLPRFSGYAGLAYDHEFAGKAKAKTNGREIDAPSLKGGTGTLEVGVTAQPSADQPLTLSFGVQGHAGKREGATASFRLNYAF